MPKTGHRPGGMQREARKRDFPCQDCAVLPAHILRSTRSGGFRFYPHRHLQIKYNWKYRKASSALTQP